MQLVFDTETSGFKTNHIIQLAYALIDDLGNVLNKVNTSFKLPEGVKIEEGAFKCHGIKDEDLKDCEPIEKSGLALFIKNCNDAKRVIGHNVSFDIRMIKNEYNRHKSKMPYLDLVKLEKKSFCTMKSTTQYCRISKATQAGYKWPKLQELHKKLFGNNFEDAHDALADVMATHRCFVELLDRKVIKI